MKFKTAKPFRLVAYGEMFYVQGRGKDLWQKTDCQLHGMQTAVHLQTGIVSSIAGYKLCRILKG